jgi:hypothetical protein
LRQFIAQKAKGVLMVPMWKSSRVWPVLAPNGKHFIKLATRFLVFSPKLVVGREVTSDTFKKRQPFLIMRVNGEVADPWEENVDFLACVMRGCVECDD